MGYRQEKPKKGCIGQLFGVMKLGLLILLGVFAFVIWASSRSDRVGPRPDPVVAAPPRPAIDPPAVGEDGILEIPGAAPSVGIWLAATDDDWPELIDALNQRAAGGPGAGAKLYRMGEAGRARAYASGSRVVVRKYAFASRLVEILDGEDAGRTGWVQVEFVRRP